MKIPKHVAIILDGNGRWAKKRHLPRNMGHRQGSKVVEQIIEDAHDLGIKYLTVYAFSTENWKRPQDEVNALMKLLRDYLKTCIKRANKNNMKVRVIGDITGLSEDLQEKIVELEKASKDNTGINFTIALNYGSRDEMVRAMRHMADDLSSGNLSKDMITEEVFNGLAVRYTQREENPLPYLMQEVCFNTSHLFHLAHIKNESSIGSFPAYPALNKTGTTKQSVGQCCFT